MTPTEREPSKGAAFDLAIARSTVAPGLTFACASVSDQIAAPTRQALERLMDDDERATYGGLRDDGDRRCYAAAHALLRIELSYLLSLAPQDWQFVPRAGALPEIRTPLGRTDSLRFSVSHTPGLVACAVADSRAGIYGEVGIDVECVRKLPDMAQLAERHFAAPEIQDMRALPSPQRPARFFALWTLKQAWAKACCAAKVPAHARGPAVFAFDRSGSIAHVDLPPGEDLTGRWRFWIHKLDQAHVVALAARRRQALA